MTRPDPPSRALTATSEEGAPACRADPRRSTPLDGAISGRPTPRPRRTPVRTVDARVEIDASEDRSRSRRDVETTTPSACASAIAAANTAICSDDTPTACAGRPRDATSCHAPVQARIVVPGTGGRNGGRRRARRRRPGYDDAPALRLEGYRLRGTSRSAIRSVGGRSGRTGARCSRSAARHRQLPRRRPPASRRLRRRPGRTLGETAPCRRRPDRAGAGTSRATLGSPQTVSGDRRRSTASAVAGRTVTFKVARRARRRRSSGPATTDDERRRAAVAYDRRRAEGTDVVEASFIAVRHR